MHGFEKIAEATVCRLNDGEHVPMLNLTMVMVMSVKMQKLVVP